MLLHLKKMTTLFVTTAFYNVNLSLCQSSPVTTELSSLPESPQTPDSCLFLSCIYADLLRPFLSPLSRRDQTEDKPLMPGAVLPRCLTAYSHSSSRRTLLRPTLGKVPW